MRSNPLATRAAAVALLLGTFPAFGAPPPEEAVQGPVAVATEPRAELSSAEPEVADAGGIGSPLATGALDDMRGGDGTTTNTVDLLGRVDGNTAEDVVSGSNVIQGGAFGSSSGISTVIQNSGSNVLIQNGMVVNVQFVDPTP